MGWTGAVTSSCAWRAFAPERVAPQLWKAAIATAKFPVSDQDAALVFSTGTLGWEVRSDVRFGAEGEAVGP